MSIFPHIRPLEAPRWPQEEVWALESPAAHHPGFSITLPFVLNMPFSASSVWKALSAKLPHLFVYSYLPFQAQLIYNFLRKNLLWPSYLLSLSPNQVKPPPLLCVILQTSIPPTWVRSDFKSDESIFTSKLWAPRAMMKLILFIIIPSNAQWSVYLHGGHAKKYLLSGDDRPQSQSGFCHRQCWRSFQW